MKTTTTTLWLSAAMALVLMIDVLLSLYKIIIFRDAISEYFDFAATIATYLGVVVIAALTFLSAAVGLKGGQFLKHLVVVQCVGGSLTLCLLLLNFLNLPEWTSTALLNKNMTLIACLILNGFIFFSLRAARRQ